MNLFWEVPNRDLTQDDIDGVINVTRNIINESKGCGPGYASYTANNKTFCRKNGKPTGNEHLYYNNKDDNAELTDDHLSCSNWTANGECKKILASCFGNVKNLVQLLIQIVIKILKILLKIVVKTLII